MNLPFSSSTNDTTPALILTNNNGQLIINGESVLTSKQGTQIKIKKQNKMPMEFCFKLIKKKMGILEKYKYEKWIKKLEKAVKEAEKNGQIAFSEELMKRLLILIKEIEFISKGGKMFINSKVIDFFKNKTERNLNLTNIKNFARPIPKNILNEKKKYENIFDDFCILHTDSKNVVKETEKEKSEKRKRDPILFGLIEFSERLYFIADWEDKLCDLTLDEIIDELDIDEKDITFDKQIKI